MNTIKKLRMIGIAMLTLIVLTSSIGVMASPVVGLSSPDSVERGYSIKVVITASGATAGTQGVELYVKYDPASVQFVKVNSTFLGVAGGQVASPDAGSIFEMQDTSGGIIKLIAVDVPYTPVNEVIAELEFTANVDANIGPVEFLFVNESFVQTVNGRVDATSEKLILDITGAVEAPISDTPVQPQESSPLPSEGGIDVPYDPNNQVSPNATTNGSGSAYGIGILNEETTIETTTAQTTELKQETTKPTVPDSKRPEKDKDKENMPSQSPLKMVTGETLFPPEDALPIDKIPDGFQGGMEEIQGVLVPYAKNSDKNLTLYYLETTAKKPSFYTYEEGTERFKRYDLEKMNARESETQSTFTALKDGEETWKVLLISLIGLSSLSIMIYTIHRNLRRP